jgi:hypothetical protein
MTAPLGPRALFDGLFDDAALFPPGDAPMTDAVPAHRRHRERLDELVGPFVVPAARLEELVAHLGHGEGPAFDISVTATAGDLPSAVDRVTADPRLTLAAVEVPVVADAVAAGEAVGVLDAVLPAGVPAAVEVPRTDDRDAVLDVLAGTRCRAKLRTGGVRADLFPSPAELAGTFTACAQRGIAVKCTAGLHSAVRHLDPATGFPHHGFLNLLLAADAVSAGSPAETWLAETDSAALVAAVLTWGSDQAARARALFTSFGTCSVTEPVDDLVALGLLPSPERTPA